MSALVLIVEHDDGIREWLATQLGVAGYRTMCAADGGRGLALLRGGERPAVIILDSLLPDVSGIEFVAELRRSQDLAVLPVLIIAGGRGLLERPIIVAEVVPQPASVEDLLDSLRRLLS